MILYIILAISILSLGFAIYQAIKVLKNSPGNEKMKELSDMIHNGAMTFLNKEYIYRYSYKAQ